MAYDSQRRKSVLFGGYRGSFGAPQQETWEWDGDNWIQRYPANSPSRRAASAMAFDSRRGRIVLFGGEFYDDTWEYDGVDWKQRMTPTTPPARSAGAMAYDPVNGVIVMFGGSGPSGVLDDTWTYDGTDWRQLTRTPRPAAIQPSMVFDPVNRAVVIVGDRSQPRGWQLIGGSWVSYVPPFSGWVVVAGVDELANRVLVFLDDMPLINSWYGFVNSWSLVTSGPPRRTYAACAGSVDGVVLYGGLGRTMTLDDTWTFRSPRPVFPDSATTVSGNERFDNLLNVPAARVQTIMEADGFGPTRTGLVRSLWLRREPGNSTLARRTVSIRVQVGLAGRVAETMSTRFADNWQGASSTAFTGQVDVPTSGPSQSPAPFELEIPFTNPFTWNGQDLTVELAILGTMSTAPWPVDAVSQPRPIGTVQAFGQACRAPSGRTPSFILPNPADLVPGGHITSGLRDATLGAIAFTILGDSDTSWAGLPLPFTFPGSTCTIYNNLVVSLSTVVGASGSAATSLPIGSSPSLGGLRLFGQWAVLEGPSANPPVTLTEAARMQLGHVPPVYYDSIVNFDGSPIGQKTAGKYSSLVYRLDL